jgi:hypothetical protein
MPRCGATFGENIVPLGQGGTSGGFLNGGSNPTPALRATSPMEEIFKIPQHHWGRGVR